LYVDVTLTRYVAQTGQEPILEATGERFSAVADRRQREAVDAIDDWDIV